MKKLLLALAVGALVLMPLAVMADSITYTICDGNDDLQANNPPYAPPYAKVEITVPDGGGFATFEISAFGDYTFGGNQAFAATFAETGAAGDVDFLDLAPVGANPFSYVPGTQNVSAFGNFDDIIEQQSFNLPATFLKFEVQRTFADAASVLLQNADGYFIAMHIKLPDTAGSTGYAGDCVPPQAPIPGSLLLLGTGVLGLIGLRRKF